ncbi:hypothetical protein ACFQ23_14280, partial [Schaalia naturae]|uniref:hypothetical protein n=1 Tax=Schaalia naturae TaxID=635203 RepID=UPI003640A38B
MRAITRDFDQGIRARWCPHARASIVHHRAHLGPAHGTDPTRGGHLSLSRCHQPRVEDGIVFVKLICVLKRGMPYEGSLTTPAQPPPSEEAGYRWASPVSAAVENEAIATGENEAT